jgi:hypothetical protein
MTTAQQKKIEHLVEQKILEFLGDPDSGLSVRKDFVATLKRRSQKGRKLVSHRTVAKRYGVR